MKARRFIAATVVVPVLAACQPAPSTPTITDRTSTSTPTTSSPTTPSREELFREASEVYRKIRVGLNGLEASGGANELPTSITPYVTGTLETNLHAVYVQSWPQQRKIRTGPAPELRWIRAYPEQWPREAVTATIACVDATKSIYRIGNRAPTTGIVQQEILYYAMFDGQLKAFNSGWKDADQC